MALEYPRTNGSILIGLAIVAASLPALTGATDGVREWRFVVLLDGRPIGEHDFRVSGTGEAGEVVSHARLVVTALRIPVYRYEHEDHERWASGCLREIDAKTDDDGHALVVHGVAGADGFLVSGPDGANTWPGCVRSFAYWDPRMLDAARLLNPQTGTYEAVRVIGPEETGGSGTTSKHYRLEGRHLHIDLWYTPAGEWRALESRTESGKTLRYELRS
jgi:hypothetical protein